MQKTLLEKMFLKPTYTSAMIHMPEEMQTELSQSNSSNSLSGTYTFIVAFYTTKSDLEKEVNVLKKSLEQAGLLWIAYPKAKALKTDLNRDILREFMKGYAMDTVSIVSLSETWSALRFKKL